MYVQRMRHNWRAFVAKRKKSDMTEEEPASRAAKGQVDERVSVGDEELPTNLVLLLWNVVRVV